MSACSLDRDHSSRGQPEFYRTVDNKSARATGIRYYYNRQCFCWVADSTITGPVLGKLYLTRALDFSSSHFQCCFVSLSPNLQIPNLLLIAIFSYGRDIYNSWAATWPSGFINRKSAALWLIINFNTSGKPSRIHNIIRPAFAGRMRLINPCGSGFMPF